jgi:tRNA(Ile2) C34 agmatinyltransferase TiaS
LSSQKFVTISDFATEMEEHVMVLRLAGDIGQNPVTKPVTVKQKPKCVTCGRTNKATSKFCVDCGTSLQIV